MALQGPLHADGSGMAILHGSFRLRLVFYSEQSEVDFWRDGR